MAKEIQPAQVFEDVLAAAAKMPGVHIDRESFLRNSLKKYCDDATIEKAIIQPNVTSKPKLSRSSTCRKRMKARPNPRRATPNSPLRNL